MSVSERKAGEAYFAEAAKGVHDRFRRNRQARSAHREIMSVSERKAGEAYFAEAAKGIHDRFRRNRQVQIKIKPI